MRIRRLAGVVAATALLLGSMGTAAVAAAPVNDDVTTPEVVMLPFSLVQDTSEASAAIDDPVPDCIMDPVGTTVWFAYTATDDGYVEFDTFGSDYDTVMAVYAGEAIAANEVACSDDAGGLQSKVRVNATSGVTYLVMVGSFPGDPGGTLSFQADVGTPPIELTVSVDGSGTVIPKTGTALLRGTVTCSEPTSLIVDSWLRQRSGRVYIDGYGYSEVECDGSATWELVVEGANGLFSGGKADAQVVAFSLDDDEAFAFTEQAVRLSGVKTSKK